MAVPHRLERAIKELKPTPTNIDPTTKFWTVYQKAADEYDRDLLDRYARDLDTTLLFVRMFTFLVCLMSLQPRSFSVLGGSLLCCYHNFHCASHSAKPIGPIGISRGCSHQCFLRPDVSPSQFGFDIIGGLSYCVGETMDPVLPTGLGEGGYH